VRLIAIACVALVGSHSPPVTYSCDVTRKLDGERVYTTQDLARGRFGVRVRDDGNVQIVSRCSFASRKNKVTCDDYSADHVAIDQNIGARKYYVFDSQFDVQIFADLSFVENNGRGGIAFGRCTMTPG
jgi:hypothetical protein